MFIRWSECNGCTDRDLILPCLALPMHCFVLFVHSCFVDLDWFTLLGEGEGHATCTCFLIQTFPPLLVMNCLFLLVGRVGLLIDQECWNFIYLSIHSYFLISKGAILLPLLTPASCHKAPGSRPACSSQTQPYSSDTACGSIPPPGATPKHPPRSHPSAGALTCPSSK